MNLYRTRIRTILETLALQTSNLTFKRHTFLCLEYLLSDPFKQNEKGFIVSKKITSSESMITVAAGNQDCQEPMGSWDCPGGLNLFSDK